MSRCGGNCGKEASAQVSDGVVAPRPCASSGVCTSAPGGLPSSRPVTHRVFHNPCTDKRQDSTRASPAAATGPDPAGAGRWRLWSCLPGLLLDPVGELGDLVVDAAALGEQLADLLVRVHHRGVVAA